MGPTSKKCHSMCIQIHTTSLTSFIQKNKEKLTVLLLFMVLLKYVTALIQIMRTQNLDFLCIFTKSHSPNSDYANSKFRRIRWIWPDSDKTSKCDQNRPKILNSSKISELCDISKNTKKVTFYKIRVWKSEILVILLNIKLYKFNNIVFSITLKTLLIYKIQNTCFDPYQKILSFWHC